MRLGGDAADLLTLAVKGPYGLVDSLRLQRFGRLDPCARAERTPTQERYARCTRTPEGPATLVAWMARESAAREPGTSNVEVALYGSGAGWLRPRLRQMLGLDDEAVFAPSHPRLVPLRAAFRATRLVRALSLAELHAVLVLQQRVTFGEAARAWRAVTLALDERAPGPLPLFVPPGAEHWLGMSQPRARAFGIDARRWEALQQAARAASEIEARAEDHAALKARAMAIPGTGPWTTGLLLGLGAADADAVITGDVHLPHDVSAFLTDVPHGNDARMLELLEPFRPHRFRVVRVMMGLGRRRL